jgi:hypothetical protein
MDSLAQQMLACGIIIFLFFAGIALLMYVNNKFGGNDDQ